MLDLPAENNNGSFAWNELQAAELLRERPLLDFSVHPIFSRQATPDFVLVLPEQIKVQIIEHAARGGGQEQAGILIGQPYRDPEGFVYTVITAAIPVDDAETSITQVKLRPSCWPAIWQELLQDSDQRIVGWYHSHPDYGIFLSATDRLTQNTYFSAPWQVALVVDPIRDELGVFVGTSFQPLASSAMISI